jgi:hypothetical protein
MRISPRAALALVAAAIAGVTAFYLVPKPLPELSRAEFIDEVRAGHVHSVVIEDQELITGVSSTRGRFRTGFCKAEDGRLPAELHTFGVEIRFEKWRPGLI